MKHCVMAFLVLFSALSFSWAGTEALVDSNQKSEPNVLQLQDVVAHGCASMQQEHFVQNIDNSYCANCFDNCQCDNNSTCHKMNSPLVGLHLNVFDSPNRMKMLIVFVPSSLQNPPVFLNFRPPKIS